MVLKYISSALLAGLLTGCVSEQARFVTPEQFSQTRAVRAEARTLRAGDDIELAVEVNGSKEVPLTTLKIGHNGTVPAPIVGDVVLEGMTVTEGRVAFEKRYNRIFTSTPLITLRMADDKLAGEWGFVTVLGQVRNPGRYAVRSSVGMTLSDSLHEAGGFAQNANMKNVVVTRKSADGKLVQCASDITKLGRAGAGQYDLNLFDGDIVQVPERMF